MDGAGQHYTAEQCGCLEYCVFSVNAARGENLLESIFEGFFEFRRRAGHLLSERGHGATIARIVSMPWAQVPVRVATLALLRRGVALRDACGNALPIGNSSLLKILLRVEVRVERTMREAGGLHYFADSDIVESPFAK